MTPTLSYRASLSWLSCSLGAALLVSGAGCSGRIDEPNASVADVGGGPGTTAQGGSTMQTGGTTAVGGTTAAGGTTPIGGASATTGGGETGAAASCVSPDCCVPLTLTAQNLSLYYVQGSLVVHFVAARDGSVRTGEEWLIEASVTLGVGGGAACASPYSVAGSQNYAAVECPAIPNNMVIECGSSMEVSVVLRSNLVLASTGTSICTAESPGTMMKFNVPVECPTCNAATNQPCDVPSVSGCTAPSLGSNGTTYQLPCQCNLYPDDGTRRWACAVT